MHSASVTFLLGYVEWKNVEKMNPLPSNGPWMVTDVSERMNAFPTHTLNHFQFNKLAKLQFSEQKAVIFPVGIRPFCISFGY